MMDVEIEQPPRPHVVFLPFPLQGHVKPMLTLAKLLHLAGGFRATFINSDHNHHRLLRSPASEPFLRRHPDFHFVSFPDGLPPEVPRDVISSPYLLLSTPSILKPRLREILAAGISRPTCLVADGIFSFAMEVAEELGIPAVALRTYSAHFTWMMFHFRKLIDDGIIPTKGEDIDGPLTSVPGLESILRPRDLAVEWSNVEPDNTIFELFMKENLAITSRGSSISLVLDTFDDLEGSMISRIKSIVPNTYTVGPLHGLLKSRASDSSALDFSSSLWSEDRSSVAWLDSKPPKSVVYVGLGSVVVISPDQLLELWHGLANSGKLFLWVIRPGLVEPHQVPEELERATEERGLIVSWAPQEEVLAHPAVGCFLTHNGWNSTLEGIFAGTPMVGLPWLFDQPVNSRCVEEVWRVGLDMKNGLDRASVEKTVRVALDEDKREEMMESVDRIATAARKSVEDGGSSWRNLDRFVDDIRSMARAEK